LVGPVEPDAGRLGPETLRLDEGGESGRNSREDRAVLSLRARVRFLLFLDLLPAHQHFGGVFGGRFAEHVGVAPDHLRGDPFDDIGGRERPILRREPGQEDDLEKEIAQLFAEAGEVPAVESVHDFVALLDQIAAQRGVGLLPVPRATARAAEPVHDGNEVVERAQRGHGCFLDLPGGGLHVSQADGALGAAVRRLSF
jgi:hypothetical protein